MTTTQVTRFAAYDVAIVGAGHNGLVAAAYLARAGLSVVVLERLGQVGGAAVSMEPFAGWPVRISPYADLVSLLPGRVITDLDLDLRLASRPVASYTPVVRDGKPGGLVVEREESKATRTSFRELTGFNREYDAWCTFHADVAGLARTIEPTLLEPLRTERDLEAQVDPAIWRDFVTTPLGTTIERRFTDDTVRGLVASDGLVGTFASMDDPSLVQNRCFLYRRMGRGTGEERVPIGGMGAVSEALARSAVRAGAEIQLGAGVSAIRPGPDLNEVDFDTHTGPASVQAKYVLANVAPWVLHILLGEPDDAETKPQGAQFRMNLLLHRLPRLKSGIDPRVAFAGTMHVSEGYAQLEAAYRDALSGHLPRSLPGQISCHTLTDKSVLGDAPSATHTLTYLGLHTPAEVFAFDPQRARDEAARRALLALDEHLVDPIDSCLARDASGRPCLEVKVPQELEADLAMPGGHMYHADLEWPWASNRARLDAPDQQWGCSTGLDRVLVCGAGTRRGGGVSGIGGHNAAMAVLASR